MPNSIRAVHLKALRHAAGWTQKDLGERSGIHPLMISFYEKGVREPSVDSLVAMADALGVAVDTILDRDPPTSGPCVGFTVFDLRPYTPGSRYVGRKAKLTQAEAERLAAALAREA